jgi:hypothetical protein
VIHFLLYMSFSRLAFLLITATKFFLKKESYLAKSFPRSNPHFQSRSVVMNDQKSGTKPYNRYRDKPKKKKQPSVEPLPEYEVTIREDATGNREEIRRVKPMIQSFETFAKGRWIGREMIDVLTKEFGGYSPEYWNMAFQLGNIRINGHPVPRNYIFRNSDRFLHRTHR